MKKKNLIEELEELADESGLAHLHHRILIRLGIFVDALMFADENNFPKVMFNTKEDFLRWKEKFDDLVEEKGDNLSVREWIELFIEFYKEKC